MIACVVLVVVLARRRQARRMGYVSAAPVAGKYSRSGLDRHWLIGSSSLYYTMPTARPSYPAAADGSRSGFFRLRIRTASGIDARRDQTAARFGTNCSEVLSDQHAKTEERADWQVDGWKE